MEATEGTGSAPEPDQSPQPRLRRSTTIGLDLGEGDIDRIIEDSFHGYVDNPFRRWDPDVVETISRMFARSYNLGDKEELFVKAGAILWNPTRWMRLRPTLERDEIRALEREQGSFWQQPKMLHVTSLLLFVAAMVQGWTQTVSNVANLKWPVPLGLLSFGKCVLDMDEVVIFAIVNASTYFAASMFGCWLSDPLSEIFLGRRTPIFISAVIIMAATIGSAACQTWEGLLACRILLGIGMGCKATVTPVFAAEVAPSHLRGTLVVNWQLFNALGMCLGFASNLGMERIRSTNPADFAARDDLVWRLQIATLCVPTAAMLIITYICPESPRFQMKKSSQRWNDRMSDAWRGKRGVKTWFKNVCRACFCLYEDDDSVQNTRTAQVSDRETTTDAERSTLVSAHDQEDCAQDPLQLSIAEPEAADYRKAFKTFEQLRASPLLAAKELLYVHVQMVVEMRATFPESFRDRGSAPASDRLAVWLLSPTDQAFTYPQKIRHLWTVPRIRRATVNAVVCMVSQQLCGVNVLAFYSSTVFSTTICAGGQVNTQDLTPLWLGFGIGCLFFVLAIPAYWTIERPGRRASLLTTIPFMAVFMLGACLAYLIPKHHTIQHAATIGSFVFLFIAAYSPGMGPVPFTMSSEVFPLEHRMVGMSTSVFANLFGAGALALIVPPIAQKKQGAGNSGLLGLFAALNVVAFFCILLFVRETAGTADENATKNGTGKAISLEELMYIFQRSTDDFLQFQREEMLPYALDCLKWPTKRIWEGWLKGEKVQRPVRPKMPTTGQHRRDGVEMDVVSRTHSLVDGNGSI